MSLLVSRREALYQKLKASNKGFGLQLTLHNSILSLLIYNMLSTYQSLGSPHEVSTPGKLMSKINKCVCVSACVNICMCGHIGLLKRSSKNTDGIYSSPGIQHNKSRVDLKIISTYLLSFHMLEFCRFDQNLLYFLTKARRFRPWSIPYLTFSEMDAI